MSRSSRARWFGFAARFEDGSGRVRLLLLSLVAGVSLLAGATRVPVVVAQAAACAVPAATAGPAATPGAATPVVAPTDAPAAASPTLATPAAGPDQAAAAREIEAVARALAACLSDGDNETVARLATPNYLGQVFGGGPPLAADDFVALAEAVPAVPMRIESVGEIEVGDDAATAGVVSVVGNQLVRARWHFVLNPAARRGQTAWRVDAEDPLPVEPPTGAATIGVAMEEYEFGLDADAARGPDVVLEGRNGGSEDHEMLVLRLADGTTTQDILRAAGPGLPEGVTFIGQVTVPADDRAELVLVDLDPGIYTIVCLLPAANGVPHLAAGMEVDFEVE